MCHLACLSNKMSVSFFIKLADVCIELDSNVSIRMRWDFCCCSCGYQKSKHQQNRLFSVSFPDNVSNVGESNVIDMHELIASAMEWTRLPGSVCSSCGVGEMEQREMLISATDIVIIALKLFAYTIDGTCYKPALGIINAENSTINLDGTIYTLHSLIHHHRTTPNSGHYTSVHRIGGKWILSNDMIVQSVKFDKASTNVYMLFYHRHSDSTLSTSM